MIRRTVFIIVLCCSTALAAQQADAVRPVPVTGTLKLTGIVVDGSLNPIAGATITAERDGRVVGRTTSDAKGAYALVNVAPGRLRVRAEAAEFEAFSRDITVPGDRSTVQLPVVLIKPSTIRVPPLAEPASTAPPGTGVTLTTASAGADASGQGPIQVRIVTAPTRKGRSTATIDGATYHYQRSGETYSQFEPNSFQPALEQPLSTFGADVDTASYSNIRRFLNNGELPPGEAVRIEELVNYFRFGYAAPRDDRPIALTTEVGDCPWAPSHKLVLIGARAAVPPKREPSARNLVLLIDVSGSMMSQERLPLIKTALGLFVDTLRPDDTLSIVTYAGMSGLALPPTAGRERSKIHRAIAQLESGGSTNGAEGIVLAYRVALQSFIPGGINRVILATDGDFNVGVTSQRELLTLIERERETGVFLSVLGVGTGNLKDATMEMLADRGNGNYAYLDSLQEARRVLIREGDSTLDTVATDVKFQVEFNPAIVGAWKLLGYENRALAAQDFNDDRKDAGDMGAGHTVTVLYEVIPAGIFSRSGNRAVVDPLKYQTRAAAQPAGDSGGEWLTVKVRYKLPGAEASDVITQPVKPGPVKYLSVASAVAEFGLVLRDTPRNLERWQAVLDHADRLIVPTELLADMDGFKELVATAAELARRSPSPIHEDSGRKR